MKYLIKDLAAFTGLSPARIRKWQLRYNFLKPKRGSNGYNYYTNEDLFLLKHIASRVDKGRQVSSILSDLGDNGYEVVFAGYSKDEKMLLENIINGHYEKVEAWLSENLDRSGMNHFIHGPFKSLLELVGRAWAERNLSVSDEHSFSRWLNGWLQQMASTLRMKNSPKTESLSDGWLIASYHKDHHEFGCMAVYLRAMNLGIKARMAGHLPKEELFEEVRSHNYRAVFLSLTMPVTRSEVSAYRSNFKKNFPGVKLILGGWGYRNRGIQSNAIMAPAGMQEDV